MIMDTSDVGKTDWQQRAQRAATEPVEIDELKQMVRDFADRLTTQQGQIIQSDIDKQNIKDNFESQMNQIRENLA